MTFTKEEEILFVWIVDFETLVIPPPHHHHSSGGHSRSDGGRDSQWDQVQQKAPAAPATAAALQVREHEVLLPQMVPDWGDTLQMPTKNCPHTSHSSGQRRALLVKTRVVVTEIILSLKGMLSTGEFPPALRNETGNVLHPCSGASDGWRAGCVFCGGLSPG